VAKRFVFLEILDPELNALIGWLREAAMGTPSRHNIHITIRGPYSTAIPEYQIARYQNTLRRDPIIFEGVGEFRDGDRRVVYLKVQHPKLRQIWWKPDFPVKEFGFNPHITIFEGTDSPRADAIFEFLKKERLQLLTSDFEVTSRVSDHRDMFGEPTRKKEPFLKLVNRGLVRADVINRFERTLRSVSRAA
jgi:2'-5' RNA ligase